MLIHIYSTVFYKNTRPALSAGPYGPLDLHTKGVANYLLGGRKLPGEGSQTTCVGVADYLWGVADYLSRNPSEVAVCIRSSQTTCGTSQNRR